MYPNEKKNVYVKFGKGLGYNKYKITIWLWIGCTLVTLVNSQQNFYTNGRYGKRGDPRAASSFWAGSRYGRGIGDTVKSSLSLNEDKNDVVTKDVEVSPRMDRFFLGSRYGKRTISKDRFIDSTLKHFETSLDFLISFDNLQTNDKQQLKIINKELRDKEKFATSKFYDNNLSESYSQTEFACIYTGVTNLYRCFHRKSNGTNGSSNLNED